MNITRLYIGRRGALGGVPDCARVAGHVLNVARTAPARVWTGTGQPQTNLPDSAAIQLDAFIRGAFFQRQLHYFRHRLHVVNFHLADLLALQIFTHVHFVLER